MAGKIELRTSDLTIAEFTDKRTGEEVEIVRLAFRVAIDPVFIQEMKDAGVTKYVQEGVEAKKPKTVDLRGKEKAVKEDEEDEGELEE